MKNIRKERNKDRKNQNKEHRKEIEGKKEWQKERKTKQSDKEERKEKREEEQEDRTDRQIYRHKEDKENKKKKSRKGRKETRDKTKRTYEKMQMSVNAAFVFKETPRSVSGEFGKETFFRLEVAMLPWTAFAAVPWIIFWPKFGRVPPTHGEAKFLGRFLWSWFLSLQVFAEASRQSLQTLFIFTASITVPQDLHFLLFIWTCEWELDLLVYPSSCKLDGFQSRDTTTE